MFRSTLLLVLLFAATAAAQEPAPLPPADRAPVVLDGRVLFEVGESGSWSPRQRAAEINRTLRAAALGRDDVNLLLAEFDGYPVIRMGDWHLLTVADSDVPPGMDGAEQAQRWLQIVETALRRARTERTGVYVTAAWFQVLVLAAGAALLTFLLGRISARVPIWLLRRRGHPSAPDEKPAWRLALELACAAGQIAAWVGVALYAAEQFPAARQLRYRAATLVGGTLSAPLFAMGGHAYSAADLLWVIGAVAALWLAVSLLTRVLSFRLVRVTGATPGTIQPVATVLRYALTGIGLIVVLQAAGLDLSSLAIFASVLGVGIGFGLQSIANNFVSGLILSFERAIKPGDFVSIGSLQGTVQRLGARSTVIRTQDRVSIIVPNARLLESEVVNWSYGDDLARLHLPIAIAPGADVQAIRAALLEAARAHPAVLADPRAEVRFTGFADHALNLELLVWTNNPAGHGTLESDLYFRIEANLRHAGLADPFPNQTIQVRQETVAGTPAAVAERDADAASSAANAPAPNGQPFDIESLVAGMRGADGVAIADRRHLLGVYRHCFVGSEAVAWLMRTCALSRDEAVRLGQSLVQRGVFHHVLDEHPFRDGNFFYRFYADESS